MPAFKKSTRQRMEQQMRVYFALVERAKDRGQWDYEREDFARRIA